MALLAVPAMAQTKPAASSTMTSSSDPAVVAAGISFLHVTNDTGPGFFVDFAKDFMHNDRVAIGAAGDFGLNHFTGGTETSYTAGPRVGFIIPDAKVRPFAQLLFGANHVPNSTDFAYSVGGGVDIKLTPKLNFRGQIDFRQVKVDTGGLAGVDSWFGETRVLVRHLDADRQVAFPHDLSRARGHGSRALFLFLRGVTPAPRRPANDNCARPCRNARG